MCLFAQVLLEIEQTIPSFGGRIHTKILPTPPSEDSIQSQDDLLLVSCYGPESDLGLLPHGTLVETPWPFILLRIAYSVAASLCKLFVALMAA